MKVLIACEYSGTVRDAFAALGHDAVSCDLLPSDTEGQHYMGNVMDIIHCGWDLMIAHPPCTYLSNSGVSWLYKNTERWKDLIEGAVFFRSLLDAPIPLIAVENPIQHKYARAIIGQSHSQVIQPYMFGHTESKATCLWLKGLPLLKPTNNVKQEMKLLPKNQQQRLHYLPPSEDRWKIRSTTYKGIAQAMASQWGNININIKAA
jgi:hypothetical protein